MFLYSTSFTSDQYSIFLRVSPLIIPNTQKNYTHEYFDECIKQGENSSLLMQFATIMIRKSTLDRIFKNKIYVSTNGIIMYNNRVYFMKRR